MGWFELGEEPEWLAIQRNRMTDQLREIEAGGGQGDEVEGDWFDLLVGWVADRVR